MALINDLIIDDLICPYLIFKFSKTVWTQIIITDIANMVCFSCENPLKAVSTNIEELPYPEGMNEKVIPEQMEMLADQCQF